jgi:hypothetical protein
MRLLFASAAPLMLVMLVMACNTVDPSECWPNTSGGLGGGGTIPIGAGVGAVSSGDFISPPPDGPLGHDDPPNACVTPSSPDDGGPDGGGTELSTYIRCWGLGPTACAARCNAVGAYCVEFATHTENPSIGIGALKQCMENTLSYTCSYCYDNGDVCTILYARFGIGMGGCTNTGGKGCE